MSIRPEILPYGDAALLVQYAVAAYSQSVVTTIHALASQLQASKQWTDVICGYDSLLVTFDTLTTTQDMAHERLTRALLSVSVAKKPSRIFEVPVCYADDFALDMKNIVASSGLDQEAIISLHSAQTYLVCMMGFIPGFVFLSEAPKRLHHSRHPSPRAHVPRGSVGIAGWQTGIYGLDSPGGWQIIGRSPLKIFDPKSSPPMHVLAGDQVRFIPISADEYDRLDQRDDILPREVTQ